MADPWEELANSRTDVSPQPHDTQSSPVSDWEHLAKSRAGGTSSSSIQHSDVQPPLLPPRLRPLPSGLRPGDPILGAPVLPESAIIPTAVGYGTSKAAEHFGAPGWASTGAGLVAGGLAGGAQSLIKNIRSLPPENTDKLVRAATGLIPYFGSKINALRDAFELPKAEPFEPVRPNPNIASKLRFGGGVDASGGPAYPRVGMSGAPEPPTPTAPNTPVRVNPNIANRLRFGGPPEPEATQSYGRVGMSGAPPPPTPTAAPAPAPFQPNRVNPNIARNLRFTPSAEPGSGTPSYRSLGRMTAPMSVENEILPKPLTPPETAPAPISAPPQGNAPDYSNITKQYQPSRTRARFDANGKRLFGSERGSFSLKSSDAPVAPPPPEPLSLPEDPLHRQIIESIMDVEPRANAGGVAWLPEVRKMFQDVPKEEFDDEINRLAREGRIGLHEFAGHGAIPESERANLVHWVRPGNPSSYAPNEQYYGGVTVRPPSEFGKGSK